MRVFADRTVTPSFVDDVAAATEQLIATRPAAGVYHCVNTGVTTWLGVAEEAARLLRLDAEIIPVSVNDVKLKAQATALLRALERETRWRWHLHADVGGRPRALRERDEDGQLAELSPERQVPLAGSCGNGREQAFTS